MKLVNAVIFFLVFISNFAYSQKKEAVNKKLTTKEYLGANYANQYSLAIQVKDYNAACSALYGLLAINQNDTNSLNTLLSIYFQRGQNEQCFILSKYYLSKLRDNATLLDFCGKSAELLERYTDALECYQKLYIITNQLYYGYQVAGVENALGRRAECIQHLDELLRSPYALSQRITLYSDSTFSNKAQNVSIKAALFYLKGTTLSDMGNYLAARECFVEAVKLEPEFELAQRSFMRIKDK